MNNKIIRFVVSTYLISWVLWITLAILTKNDFVKFGDLPSMILFILGGNGPFIAAIIIKRKDKDFKKQLYKVKVNIKWYIWILIVPFVLYVIPWTLNLFNGETSPLLRGNLLMIIPLSLVYILLGGLEEAGWRGILLPLFMKKFKTIYATIFTSIIWSFWHLPLWFIEGTSQQNINFVGYILLGLGFSFILTFIYTKTKSIFMAIMLHSLINAFPELINIEASDLTKGSIAILIYCILIYVLSTKFLNKHINNNIEYVNTD